MKFCLDPAVDRFTHGTRDENAAWRRLRFKARSHVHAVAVKIVTFDNQVAEVQPDTEYDGGVRRLAPLASAIAC